jgi:hypothetical protein
VQTEFLDDVSDAARTKYGAPFAKVQKSTAPGVLYSDEQAALSQDDDAGAAAQS